MRTGQVFTVCGTEPEEQGVDPLEGAAVARRAWYLALNQGGRCAMLSPRTKAAMDPDDETGVRARRTTPESELWICKTWSFIGTTTWTRKTWTTCGPHSSRRLAI